MTEEQTRVISELEQKYKCKIHCLEFQASEKDYAFLYMREPDLYTKMRVLDMAKGDSFLNAGRLLVEMFAIKEVSDQRFFIETEENHKFILGAYLKAGDLVEFIVGELKKK